MNYSLRYSEFCSTSSLPLGNEVCEGYVLHVSVHRGRAWQGGVHGRGRAWLGVCVHGWGGLCGRGACMVRGHAWQGGLHGRGGRAWGGMHATADTTGYGQ